MNTAPFEPSYVISLDEITWGGALVAITMVMHAIGMLAMAGLLAFAWSTGVLFTLAQDFQTQRIQSIEKRKRQESA
jgi:hypothetical protein